MNSNQNRKMKVKRVGEVDYMTTVSAQKWGNSLGIRIPKEATEKIGISKGSELELRVDVEENIIVLQPKKKKKKYSLKELLSQITPENKHSEVDFGIEGSEII